MALPVNNFYSMVHYLRMKKRWGAGLGIVRLKGAELVREPVEAPVVAPAPGPEPVPAPVDVAVATPAAPTKGKSK